MSNYLAILLGLAPPTQIALKVTEISRISVVMYVSDEIVVWQMQLTNPRDPSIKLGFWVGTRLKRQKSHKKR